LLRCALLTCLIGLTGYVTFAADTTAEQPRVLHVTRSGAVQATFEGKESTLGAGQTLGRWVLMSVLQSRASGPVAVFEDFSQTNGPLLLVSEQDVELDLPKSSEPTWAEPGNLYRGHTLQDVFNSESDLLGREILAQPGDPQFAEVAACVPPIAKMYTYSF